MSGEIICTTGEYSLRRQEVHGECTLVDLSNVNGENLNQEPLKTFDNVPLLPQDTSILLAVAYATKNEDKIEPLRRAIKRLVKDRKDDHRKVDIVEFYFEVKTGVDEQPFHPQGIQGAVNRIHYIQNALLSKKEDWTQSFDKPDLRPFDRIIIPSMESDIVNEGGLTPYDKPNIVLYECYTRKMVAGMGRGPGCQPELLALVKGDQTYGKVLVRVFGSSVSPDGTEIKLSHSNWHELVLGKGHDRGSFVVELCEHMHDELQNFTSDILDKNIDLGQWSLRTPSNS